MMHLNEREPFNHPHDIQSEPSRFAGQHPDDQTDADTKNESPHFSRISLPSLPALKAAGALETANNRLQELMQLFYLLSRDPAIPQDARYHVTLAQSEIALLTRLMQNIARAPAGEIGG